MGNMNPLMGSKCLHSIKYLSSSADACYVQIRSRMQYWWLEQVPFMLSWRPLGPYLSFVHTESVLPQHVYMSTFQAEGSLWCHGNLFSRIVKKCIWGSPQTMRDGSWQISIQAFSSFCETFWGIFYWIPAELSHNFLQREQLHWYTIYWFSPFCILLSLLPYLYFLESHPPPPPNFLNSSFFLKTCFWG